MQCEKCKKVKATVHLTEIHNNIKRESHLCEECAQQKGIVQKMSFDVSDVLGNLLDMKVPKSVKDNIAAKCPQCGMTYTLFRSKARFGCANDYDVFKAGVVPLLEKIHGSSQHCGKVPATADAGRRKESDLIKLKRELDRVIKQEDFEKAAEIRDRIKTLEEELKGKKQT